MSLKLKPNKLKQRSIIGEVNKRRSLIKHAANKSLDVRAKQRLSYHVVFLTQTGLVAVSPHVISAVMNGSSIETIFRHALHRIFYQHIDNRIEVLVIVFPNF